MNKYTKQEIIEKRLCGLKHFDKAVSKISIEKLVDYSISCFNDNRGVSPDPWILINWAVVNVIREIIDDWNACISANLDEMFNADWISYIAKRIHAPLPDTSARKRKKDK